MKTTKGFSLIEVMLVMAIITMVAAAVLGDDTIERIVRKKLETEDDFMRQLEADMRASFTNDDLNNRNIAALPGEIGPFDSPTAFSTSTSPSYTTTSNNDWFVKIARMRGSTSTLGAAPTAAVQPELARILYNREGRARLIFAAPAEPDMQRFLIVSLMDENLDLPPYQDTAAWFDAIWNHEEVFRSRGNTLPALWTTLLTPAQLAAWVDGRTSHLHRLRIRKITLLKHQVVVNNNHPSDNCWVYWNNGSGRMESLANTGTQRSAFILSGRGIRVTQGASEAAAVLKDNGPITSEHIVRVKTL